MRAALLFGREDMRVVDILRPAPGPDEALVRVVAYAPYGTDIGHYTNRGGRYARAYPYGVGADFSGIVEAVGSEVTHVRPGDRVTALALNHCGKCAWCVKGVTNLCLDAEAISRARQACCQQFTIVAANKLALMPDAVSFEQGAMLAGVVVALNGFELMEVDPARPLVVIGVGAMGLAVIATAAAMGIGTIALGGTGGRVDYARALGARVLPLESYGTMVTSEALAISPNGFDQIIETTCSDWGLKQAVEVAGRLATIGVTGGGALPDCVWDIVLRQLRLVGISCGHHQQQALDLMASGKLKLDTTISRRFTLDQAPEAFALLAGREAADIGRVIIEIGAA
ncbi:zinc-dependent alcohol dehydrogenase [Novosphingobium kaempferiae]|uniref:zinc-dependent alcohol dehydrogenase n=1 Tax=Novosphingobium kaempferiae TaxID=2896849 RepID=UPI001E415D8B|nr:alcohol dehydrogenase catalytic domain-containing protein [Novosphingobium kaempferiae]